jgi:TPR repeat protein
VAHGRASLHFQLHRCPAEPTALRLFTETQRERRTDVVYPFRLSAGPGVTEQVAFGPHPPEHVEPLVLPRGWAGSECTPGDVPSCARACKRKRATSCYLLGAAYDARGTPELADRPYRQACERGVAVACVALAPRVPTTLALLERACTLGHAEACTRAASFAERPEGRDAGHLSALFRRGCSLGDPRACLALGVADVDSPTAAEVEASGTFLLQACQRWEPEGCLRLALLLQSGRFSPRGPLTTLALLDRACAIGEAHGCAELQRMGLPAGGPLR